MYSSFPKQNPRGPEFFLHLAVKLISSPHNAPAMLCHIVALLGLSPLFLLILGLVRVYLCELMYPLKPPSHPLSPFLRILLLLLFRFPTVPHQSILVLVPLCVATLYHGFLINHAFNSLAVRPKLFDFVHLPLIPSPSYPHPFSSLSCLVPIN